jgi:hypothetical protein
MTCIRNDRVFWRFGQHCTCVPTVNSCPVKSGGTVEGLPAARRADPRSNDFTAQAHYGSATVPTVDG